MRRISWLSLALARVCFALVCIRANANEVSHTVKREKDCKIIKYKDRNSIMTDQFIDCSTMQKHRLSVPFFVTLFSILFFMHDLACAADEYANACVRVVRDSFVSIRRWFRAQPNTGVYSYVFSSICRISCDRTRTFFPDCVDSLSVERNANMR